MIRYFVSADADPYLLESYIPTWLTTHTAWADADNQPPQPANTELNGVGTEYYSADWRFAWSASKSVLLSNLTAYTASYAPWHRIGYHVCDHDSDTPVGCAWNDKDENGDIPADIPDFEVT